MNQEKINKIRKVLVEKPELHVKLVEALEGINENVGEPFEIAELVEALKTRQPSPGTAEHELYLHYGWLK
jgi:hypothetical protein